MMEHGNLAADTTTAALGRLSDDIFARAAALKEAGAPFVLATVVWSQRPSSARPGAKGIITPDGALFGWVGGSCAQPTVVRQALETLTTGQPRILRLSPDGGGASGRPEVVAAPLTCHSGGALEVFLEPFLPPLQLFVIGESPVADALVRLGHVMGYRVIAVRPEGADTAPPEATLVLDHLNLDHVLAPGPAVAIVATMGVYDEDAVERALRAGVGFVGLVASHRRFAVMRDTLRAGGVPEELLARVKAPAGLDIAATAPEEIAVSILAEVIARRGTLAPAAAPAPTPVLADAASPQPAEAVDPVCGMTVEIATARHTYDYQGTRYYFCCPACRRKFAADPAQFLGQ
ncbi:MAG: XdhC family protein [Sphaerobacter sp.]|nr:XdhC family protein [Sphaerobacter sp.]